jgi:DNA-binding MurR/RpiR family transcriptional regulator
MGLRSGTVARNAEWLTADRFARSALARRVVGLRDGGTRSNVAIAETMLRDPLRFATASVEEVAALAGVSPASVSRFARALGFEGHPGVRAALAAALNEVLNPVEKLRGVVGRRSGGPAGAGMEAIAANVEAAVRALRSGPGLAKAVRAVAAARVVYVMGFGLSAHSAGHLALGLQPYCHQVVEVAGYGGTEVAAGRLAAVGDGDVLVAITVPRYATDALRLATFARDRGARVVAITDAPAAPIARIAEVALVVPAGHPVLPASSTAILLAIECLVAGVMTASDDSVSRAEALTSALQGYLVDDGGR